MVHVVRYPPFISIHAPLTGSDKDSQIGAYADLISIHAPLTGSDLTRTSLPWFLVNFNPRSPYGERPPESM